MKLIRLIWVNLKRAVFSKRFVFAVLLVVLFEYLDIFSYLRENIESIRLGYSSRYTIVDLMQLTGNTMFWGLAFSVSLLPYSGAFVDDEKNNFLTYVTVKTNSVLYSVSTVVTCVISAFLCVVIGKIVFFSLISPVSGVCSLDALEAYGSVYESLSNGDYVLYILGNVIICGARGAFFALLAMMVSTVIKNRMVIYATPVLFYFFLVKVGYYNLHLPRYFDIGIIYISYIFGDKYEIFSVLYAIMFTLCVSVLTIFALNKKVKSLW